MYFLRVCLAVGKGRAQVQYLLQCLELGLTPLSASLSGKNDANLHGVLLCEHLEALPCMSAKPPQTA